MSAEAAKPDQLSQLEHQNTDQTQQQTGSAADEKQAESGATETKPKKLKGASPLKKAANLVKTLFKCLKMKPKARKLVDDDDDDDERRPHDSVQEAKAGAGAVDSEAAGVVDKPMDKEAANTSTAISTEPPSLDAKGITTTTITAQPVVN
ncbi:hypothetical protein N656DRAFT_219722 [Canariomyces notabilis]|uniref:Uncharacterized protein n=1 Tax=Canariomyces notabilis TaxID=2074819 RepID=A0AAN6YWZ6_9PEZI|nr:hypothetical protein N656DRAFT_219722 [Canariomyces arenarius]